MSIVRRPGVFAEGIAACLAVAAFGAAASELGDGCRAAPLFPDPVFAVHLNPLAVAGGDFDLDGFADLAVANGGSDDVSILFGKGNGDFRPELRIDVGRGVVSLVAGDFNGDGALDLAVAGERDNVVSILLNDGHGAFTIATLLAAGLVPAAIVSADFNEDGAADLAVANSASADVSILLGIGDGHFQPQRRFPVTGSSLTLVGADFDGDRHVDLLVVDRNSGNGTLLTGTGNGDFLVGAPFFFGRVQSVAAADLDGNGRADTVAADFDFDRVVFKASVPGQGFLFTGAVATVSGPHTVALTDYNRDGNLDVVAAGNGGLSVVAGHGGFVFDSAVNIDTGGFNQGIAVARIDGDDLPDVAVGDVLANTISVLLDPATRQALAPSRFAAGHTPRSLALADMDADGHLDAVVVNEASFDLSFLRGRGDGTFEPQVRIPLAGFDPTDVRVADFNRDGALDLAVMHENTREIDVLLGRGDGTFQAAVAYPLGFFAFRLAAADLSGDGIIDLVTTGEDRLAILRGIGDGTFAPPATVNAPGLSHFVAPADLNGDGVVDLALAGAGFNYIGVLLGTGGGNFGAESAFATGVFPFSVAAADFNRDGLVDLASGDSGGTVAVLLNTGGATFTPATFLPAGQTPRVLAAGDIDADGIIDLAIANESSTDVSVLIGLGDGTFKPERRFRTGGGPEYLAIGDLNEDGLPDIVTGNFGSDDISVLLNQGASPSNHPPVAVAGPDLQAECASPAGALVRLDGSGSHDSDSAPGRDDIVSYDWFEVLGSTEAPLARGKIVDVTLSLGRHDIVLRVTDRAGASATDEVVVIVQDTTPPDLFVETIPAVLWPPNHRLVDVTASVGASDACGGAVVVLESIASSEPDDAPGGGDGNTVGDIQGAAPGTPDFDFSLRAERAAHGQGRTYTIIYRASDGAGNQSQASAAVNVPLTLASISEPLMLSLRGDGSGSTVIDWTPVQDAAAYRVARGVLGNVTIDSRSINLGALACLTSSTTQTSLVVPGDADNPGRGQAFFYVAEYFNGAWSSYGTDTAPLPRVGSDGCP